ncbi:WD repeat-containing protein 74 [Armadillidium vulgare]|nr:WD repeat-containing protein 74 [Armadillidium vulgare]
MGKIDFNVFIGSETGFLKGVNLNKSASIVKNFGNDTSDKKGKQIASLCWGNSNEDEIVVGLKCQRLLTFDTDFKCFNWSRSYDLGEGPLVSAFKKEGYFITGLESGEIGILQGFKSTIINTLPKRNNSDRRIRKSTLCCVKPSELYSSQIASGGCENNLAIWDIQNPTVEVFRAKNVRHDMLDLQVPLWISDLTYLPHSNLIAAVTRHKHVRLFDPIASRRPVINFEWESNPLISLSAVPFLDKQIVVGTDHGRMALFDLRNPSNKTPLHVYKGFAGAIKNIYVHETLPLVASVSLDRYLRFHDLNTSKMLSKEFMKSRLTSVLVRKTLQMEDVTRLEPKKEEKIKTILLGGKSRY